jgi:hypothetical protein
MNRVVEAAVCAMAVLLISSAVHGQAKAQKKSSNAGVPPTVTCRTDVHGTPIGQHHRWEYNIESHYKKDKADDAQGHPHPALCIRTGDEVHWTSNASNFTFTITPTTAGCPQLFPNSPSTVPQSSHDLGPTSVTQQNCQYEVHINGIDPHIIVNAPRDHRHDHDSDGKRSRATAPKANQK